MKVAILVSFLLTVFPVSTFTQERSRHAGSIPVSREALRMRYEIQVMERVLEQAVHHGAQVTGQQVQSLMPMMLFAGSAQVRGFRLEGFGFFFDVEVPPIRRRLAWSLQQFDQLDLGISGALQSLRQHVESIPDPSRGDLEQALQRLEGRIRPLSKDAMRDVRAARPGAQRQELNNSADLMANVPSVKNPVEAYTNEIEYAVVEAMLNHSSSLGISSDEWVTVAIRDNESRLAPTDLEAVTTLMLRIQGGDLLAFQKSELTREEIKKRVEVRTF